MFENLKFEDLINKQDNAFTLAEVLVTLSIIGVVAALTIPSLLIKTQQQEFKTSAKKAHAILSQAVKLTEAETGNPIEEWNIIDPPDGCTGDCDDDRDINEDNFTDYLSKDINTFISKLNIVKQMEITRNGIAFYTADGFRYNYFPPNCFLVDVNGEKGPTRLEDELATTATYEDMNDLLNPDWPNIKLSDMFKVMFFEGKSTVIPYNRNDDTYNTWSCF